MKRREIPMITLIEASISNAKELAEISKRAFDSDVLVGASDIGGPPFYDSEKWHIRMIKANKILAIKNDEEIIGGIIIFEDKDDKSVKYVGRVFIDPKYHRMGYGIEAMNILEEQNKFVKYWRLETPIWNTRTKKFYERIGYIEMKADKNSRYFQKTISI